MADGDNFPSNSNPQENCPEDEVNTVTMVDVLNAEEILEENAAAVLGPGDDKNCTYIQGYMKRQPLYSCLTCLPVEGSERAGICLACSYHCHGDHDLIELYTKRNFRCDCGNSLFNGQKCALEPKKSETNENNLYNQNFQRLYCSCNRPYPDPENQHDDTMVQCIVCEDWYHVGHLGSPVPKDDDYAEMICGSCTDKLPFLQYYLGHSVIKSSKADDSISNIRITEDNSLNSPQKCVINNGSSAPDEGQIVTESTETQEAECNDKSLHSKEESTGEISKLQENIMTSVDKPKIHSPVNGVIEEVKCELSKSNDETEDEKNEVSLNSSKGPLVNEAVHKDNKECLLKSFKKLSRGSGATFWPDGFRRLLCTCLSCLEMYKTLNVPYLPDEQDTILVYEEEGKTKSKQTSTTQYERGMEALSSLDRVQQMEAILGYNELKTHLSEYLAKFVQNKKVVREEDIREFFSGMEARKRRKLDIPYNCR